MLEVHTIRDAAPSAVLIADRRIWLTADRSAVVEDGDARAAFLLAGQGGEIPPAEVQRLNIGLVDGRVSRVSARPTSEPETSARPAPADKAKPAPADKARRKGEDK